MQERLPASPSLPERSKQDQTPAEAAPLLAVEGLSVERGGRLVLSGLSFALRAGEVMLVTGRNGAGKSTLMRVVAGLLQPVSGTLRFGRADGDTRGVETVHYLGYEDALKPSLTVAENLAFWASMLAGASGGALGGGLGGGLGVPDALAAFGIARLAELRAGYLSAGQKRRVALARLLTVPRPLWLLDEPLIALDSEAQGVLTGLMREHAARGGAILVASHQPLALPHASIDLATRRPGDRPAGLPARQP